MRNVSLLSKMEEVRADYSAMKNMIYGAYPDFDSILNCLNELEDEIHNL